MNLFPDLIRNVDLFTVGVTVAIIGILGFVILFNNPRSGTNFGFLLFSLATIFYGIINYASLHVETPFSTLILLRLTIFSAILHAFSFFHLFYVFPETVSNFSSIYKFLVIPAVVLTAILNLTPLAFVKLDFFTPGEAPRAILGPAIPLFGVVAASLVIAGIVLLIKKTIRARDNQKTQLKLILTGTLVTFSLILIFNLIMPVIFEIVRFVSLAPVFFLPFLLFTGYAIYRHRFLDIKIIATETLSLLVLIITILQVLVSKNVPEILFRVGIFLALLIFSVLLIRSVRREVQQREKLQVLSQELAGANAELKKLDQAKSEFISIASHQLRAPLTAIKGFISLFQEGTLQTGTEKGSQVLKQLFTSADQMVKLINDLLNLSRIESGKIQYEFAENNFTQIVEEVVSEFRGQAEKKGLKLFLQNTAGQIVHLFDHDKIREVVINLIDNAIKYSNTGEVLVKLEVTRPGRSPGVVFSVKDSGLGIDEEDKKRLFAKFARGGNAQKIDPNGMGLGLYFVKRVVEDHGGRVWAESEGLGKGSTFFAELPVRQKS